MYISTIDGQLALRPGFMRAHELKQYHGLSPKGHYVCTVLRMNGFYTVLVIDPTKQVVTSSAFGNLSLEQALTAGEHFVVNESVGIPVAWYHGGDAVTQSSLDQLHLFVKSKFISSHRGKNIRQHEDGYFVIEGDYGKFNTAWSCICWIDETIRCSASSGRKI